MRIILILLMFGFFSAHGQSISLCDLEFKDSIYYKNDVPYSGKIEYYYSSGKISYSGQLKDGLLDSIFFEFKRNGKLASVCGFSGGKRAYYYRYSFLMDGISSVEKMTFPYYEFYRQKSIKKQGYYFDGEEQGLWKVYYKNGDIMKEIEYDKGEIVSPYYKWDKKGRKIRIDTGLISKKKGKFTFIKLGNSKTRIE
jgi:antitoxin component YwqK of YwqJK toxin-antitoxin module